MPFEHLSKALPAWWSNKSKQSLSLGNQQKCAQVNQLNAAQMNQLKAAQVNQLNAATVSSRSLGVEFLNQIHTVHFFIVIQTSDTEVTKGPSIYDVHTEGVQAQMDACGRGGGGQLWTSTQNIKIRHHNIT